MKNLNLNISKLFICAGLVLLMALALCFAAPEAWADECAHTNLIFDSSKNTGASAGKHIMCCNTTEGCTYTEQVDCSGGEATCISPAVCEVCNAPYGEPDSSKHNYINIPVDSTSTHQSTCSLCGVTEGEPAEHTLSYSVSGTDTIIQSCSGCSHSARVQLVSQPYEYYYTGEAITDAYFLIVSNNWLGNAPGNEQIIYTNNINPTTETNLASASITVGDCTVSGHFRIQKGQVPYNVNSYEGVYDGQEHSFSVTSDAQVYYATAQDGDYSVNAPSFKNAGDYTVYFKITPVDTNFETVESSAPLKISPAELKLTVDDISLSYGDAAPQSYNISLTGFVGGDTVATAFPSADAPSASCDYEQGKAVGDYTINLSHSYSGNQNYIVSVNSGKLSVSPRVLQLIWKGDSSFTYDGSEKGPDSVSATNIYGSDSIKLSVSGKAADAGTYTASAVLSGDDTGNYVLPDNYSFQFTVLPADRTKLPDKPGVTDESIKGKGDGKLSFNESNIEYRAEGGEFQLINSSTINVTNGKYYVRYAADNNYNASDALEVTVGYATTLKVTVPGTQTGYSLKVDNATPDYNGSAKLSFSLKDGYTKGAGFAVKVNGSAVTLASDGTYTLSNLTADAVITVEGVESTLSGPAKILTELVNALPDIHDIGPEDDKIVRKVDNAMRYWNNMTEKQRKEVSYETRLKLGIAYDFIREYRIVEGGNGIYVLKSGKSLDFKANGVYRKFTWLEIDGEYVEPGVGKYISESGSTIISLQPVFLETLSEGRHNIVVHYSDGQTYLASFTVASRYAPRTGDTANFLLWGGMLAVGLIGCGGIVYLLKKKGKKQ